MSDTNESTIRRILSGVKTLITVVLGLIALYLALTALPGFLALTFGNETASQLADSMSRLFLAFILLLAIAGIEKASQRITG